jgi:hypothetical protein
MLLEAGSERIAVGVACALLGRRRRCRWFRGAARLFRSWALYLGCMVRGLFAVAGRLFAPARLITMLRLFGGTERGLFGGTERGLFGGTERRSFGLAVRGRLRLAVFRRLRLPVRRLLGLAVGRLLGLAKCRRFGLAVGQPFGFAIGWRLRLPRRRRALGLGWNSVGCLPGLGFLWPAAERNRPKLRLCRLPYRLRGCIRWLGPTTEAVRLDRGLSFDALLGRLWRLGVRVCGFPCLVLSIGYFSAWLKPGIRKLHVLGLWIRRFTSLRIVAGRLP